MQKMIKICHILDTLNIGGLEKTLIEIISGLKEYEHQVWCLKNKGVLAKEVEDKGVLLREFDFAGGITIPALLRLSKALKRENIKIVHCHGLFPSIWGRLAAILAGVHVKIVHCQNVYYGIPKKDVIKLKLLGLFTERIIAVSEAVKKCLVEFIGINPRKITVIYNSAAGTAARDVLTREGLRKSIGLDKNDFVSCCISRIEEHKGHYFLIEAVAKCKAGNVPCKCVIAGDGPHTENLRLKIKSLGLEDRVILLGWRKDIQDLLLAMDVFIHPSTLREGLPLALAEAASAGLPLIATQIGGNSEIVEDGINGFIVPPKDAQALAEKIKYFVENPAEMKKMGERSRKIWEDKFTLQEMLHKIDSLYKSLIR